MSYNAIKKVQKFYELIPSDYKGDRFNFAKTLALASMDDTIQFAIDNNDALLDEFHKINHKKNSLCLQRYSIDKLEELEYHECLARD